MKSFNLIQLLMLSSSLMLVAQAHAESSSVAHASKRALTLPTTTVTAKRIKDAEMQNAAQMYEKPYTRHVVAAERIAQENPNDVTDAIRHIAGVTLRESGGLKKRVSIRGLSGRRVGTLIDGIKLANQGFDFGGAGEINSVDTANINRIDVIKGSPAVLYDPGTSGGAINVITKKTPQKTGIRAKQSVGIDAGYDKTKSSTSLVMGAAGWGLRASHSRQEAKDYKVKNADDVKVVIGTTNAEGEISSLPPIKIGDLGYKTQETSVKLSKALLTDAKLSLDYSDWQGDDIAFVYGRSIDKNTRALLEHMKNRKTAGLSFKKDRLGVLSNVHVRLAKQDQEKQETVHSPIQTLDSQSIIASAQYDTSYAHKNIELTSGFEYTQDKAVTAVYSDQDYMGVFANAALLMDNWNIYGGLRHNQWATNQKLLPNANPTVAEQLIGISGITPEKKVSKPTWSVGAQYQLTDNQNLSLNYSTTFRNPDLAERYAFGGVIGGGLGMLPEAGKHTELTYKFLDDSLSVNASAFYSDFDNYIHTKTIRQLTNRDGLENCIALKLCDPVKGEYNDREGDFFASYVKYYNSPKVKNHGLELSGKYFQGNHDVSADLSFNKITADDLFVQTVANPLRLNIGYKYNLSNTRFKPWIKLSTEKTWNSPTVKQQGGYDPYFVADLYAGMQLDWVRLNVGVRNILNTTYKPAFSALNGLERTFFGSLTFQWDNYHDTSSEK